MWSGLSPPPTARIHAPTELSPRFLLKLRLFAVACCRSVGDRLPDARSRKALDTPEIFAAGMVCESEEILDPSWLTSTVLPQCIYAELKEQATLKKREAELLKSTERPKLCIHWELTREHNHGV